MTHEDLEQLIDKTGIPLRKLSKKIDLETPLWFHDLVANQRKKTKNSPKFANNAMLFPLLQQYEII